VTCATVHSWNKDRTRTFSFASVGSDVWNRCLHDTIDVVCALSTNSKEVLIFKVSGDQWEQVSLLQGVLFLVAVAPVISLCV
jgi:hypothetical protein